FTVNTTVASGTGNPSGCCWAASTYRRAWRADTRYRRANARRTAAGGNRRNRPSARFTRSAYWATRARRRSSMCHERTIAYVLAVNVFDTSVSGRARPCPKQSLRLRGRSHDVPHQRTGDPAEGGAEHDAHREVDHVAAHRELFELFQHGGPPLRRASHTRAGVRGSVLMSIPPSARASSTALAMATGGEMIPLSPTPLMPSSLTTEAWSRAVTSSGGIWSARGTP